jgi:hypothetical protein
MTAYEQYTRVGELNESFFNDFGAEEFDSSEKVKDEECMSVAVEATVGITTVSASILENVMPTRRRAYVSFVDNNSSDEEYNKAKSFHAKIG